MILLEEWYKKCSLYLLPSTPKNRAEWNKNHSRLLGMRKKGSLMPKAHMGLTFQQVGILSSFNDNDLSINARVRTYDFVKTGLLITRVRETISKAGSKSK